MQWQKYIFSRSTIPINRPINTLTPYIRKWTTTLENEIVKFKPIKMCQDGKHLLFRVLQCVYHVAENWVYMDERIFGIGFIE